MKKFSKNFIFGVLIICFSFYFISNSLAVESEQTEGEESKVMGEYHPGFTKTSQAMEESGNQQAGQAVASYSEEDGVFVFQKDGKEEKVSAQDLFGSEAEAVLSSLGIQEGDKVTLTFEAGGSGTVAFVTKYNDGGNVKEW